MLLPVVIVLDGRFTPADCDYPHIGIDELGRLPSPSSVADGSCPRPAEPRVIKSPIAAYAGILRKYLRQSACSESGMPSGCWLHPLLVRHWAQRAAKLRLHMKELGRVTDYTTVLKELRRLRMVTSEELRAVRSIQLSAGYGASDASAVATDHLDRFVFQAANSEEEVRARYDAFAHEKLVENAKLSIAESKSAIARMLH